MTNLQRAVKIVRDAVDPLDGPETYSGSRVRRTWAVTRNSSTMIFGEDEEAARADYMHRAKTLHKGETIRLEYVDHVEVWAHSRTVTNERRKA